MNGRFSAVVAQYAERKFLEAAEASDNVIIDCAEVEYISSGGLRAIRRLQQTIKKNNGTLKMRNVRPEVEDVLVLTGFAAILKVE